MNKKLYKSVSTLLLISILIGIVPLMSGCCCCCCSQEIVDGFWGGYYFGFAQSVYDKGEYDDALININKALEYSPDNSEYKELKGKILEAKENKR